MAAELNGSATNYPNFDNEVSPASLPPSVAQLAALYEQEALRPLLLRRGRGQVTIKNDDRWVNYRAEILRQHLVNPSTIMRQSESELRGLLFELIASEAINTICQRAGVPYRVIPAPFDLDMSTDDSKGGDLLFVKDYEDGSCAPICLIDVKTQVRSGEIGSGMHWGLRRPLPVILVPMNGMLWEDEEGQKHDTHSFMVNRIFRFAEREENTNFLSFLSPWGKEHMLSVLKRRIFTGCDRTQSRIEKQRLTDGLERELLVKLGITQIILGEQPD